MRTTLSLDDDVLHLARGLAERDRKTIGEVVSELARLGLRAVPSPALATRNGLPQLPVKPGAGRATLDLVNRLRDEAP